MLRAVIKMSSKTFQLNTGASIPAVGLGTWKAPPGEVTAAVSHALKVGYKHIDCACCYENEDEVGKALIESFKSGTVKRDEIFITSKLWCTYHRRVEEAVDLALKSLGVDYLDLYLMHWPVPMNPKGNHPLFPRLPDGSRDLDKSWSYTQTWLELEKVLKTGKVKAIGVANFSVPFLKELLSKATIIPAVNQIENHPSLPQQEIVDFCKEKGIHITAYSPLGSTGSPMFTAPAVVEISKKKGVTPASVLLSYHIARGSSVLAKSTKPERIEENLKSFIDLDDSDMKVLNNYSEGLAKDGKLERYVYPAFGVNMGFPDKQ